jgi:hypothetical protein
LYQRASAACCFGDQDTTRTLLQRCTALSGGYIIKVDGFVAGDSSAVMLRGTNLEIYKINSRILDVLKVCGAEEAICVATFRPGATASSIAAAAALDAILDGRESTLRVRVGVRYT